MDYSKGKIYRLKSASVVDSLVYYGSTLQELDRRFSTHQAEYSIYKKNKKIYTMSVKLFEKYQDVIIELVELFPCSCKKELLTRERFYIQDRPCVNKVVPIRTEIETLENRREYRLRNKKHKQEYDKRYRKSNLKIMTTKKKNYNDKNRDKIKKYNSTRFTCEKCKKEYCRSRFKKHKCNPSPSSNSPSGFLGHVPSIPSPPPFV